MFVRQTILQHCFVALDAPEEEYRVKVRSVVTMQTVAEYAEADQLGSVLEPLMNRLMKLIQQWGSCLPPPFAGPRNAQQEQEYERIVESPLFDRAMNMMRSTLHTIQAVADSMGSAFSKTPYFGPCLGLMRQLMQRGVPGDDEMLPLRARATESIGALLVSAGKTNLPQGLIQELLDLAIVAFKFDYVPVREAGHVFFGRLAQLLDRDFAVILPTVLPVVLASMVSEEGLEERSNDDLKGPKVVGFDASDDEQIDEDDIQEETSYSFDVRTAVLDEKLASLHALQDIMVQTQDLFLPHLATTLKYLDSMTGYPNADLREEVIDSYSAIVGILRRCFPSATQTAPLQQPPNVALGDSNAPPLVIQQMTKQQSLQGVAAMAKQANEQLAPIWTKGVVSPIHPAVSTVLAVILKELLDFMDHEEGRKVAAAACTSFQKLCLAFGLGAICKDMDRIATLVLKFVNERARCQRRGKGASTVSSSGSDAGTSLSTSSRSPDLLEHDEVLIDAVTDTIVVLARVGGDIMTAFLKEALQPMVRFLDPKRPSYDRSMGIGCFGEVLDEVPSCVAPYAAMLLPTVIQGLADPAISVRRNSAFALGALCLRLPQQSLNAQTLPQIVQALVPLLGQAPPQFSYDAEDWLACKDNACSVFAKILLVTMGSEPNPQLVEFLLAGLPLQRDQMEAKYVYPCIVQLFARHPRVMFGHLPKVCCTGRLPFDS
jgi:hypothetical protein